MSAARPAAGTEAPAGEGRAAVPDAPDAGTGAAGGVAGRADSGARTDGGADDERVRATHRVARTLTVAVIAAVVLACAVVPSARGGISHVVALLGSGDVGAVVDLIRGYGPGAAAVSCALMVLQSLAAPIPAFLITFANAAVFGWLPGALLSWSSAMLGAALCFGIARVLGRDAVAHFATRGALETVDRFFERYGRGAVLVCRLLPFMSFDLVSYAAGLTGMGFWGFLAATGVGQLPATLVYSYVGGMLTGGTKAFVTALFVIFALAALAMLARQVYANRHRDPADPGPAERTGAAGVSAPRSAGAPCAAGEPGRASVASAAGEPAPGIEAGDGQ
ncbi:MAG: TVP38/TMEM64 family protein [Coriobacteriales bacterium]|jgi:uncharacterized membrane protein YdjX (TVP38/TMEM64 family)